MRILVVTNMYPSEGDVSWRGSFVKEQIDSYKNLYPDAIIDVFHIKGKVSGASNFNYILSTPPLIKKLLFGRYKIVHCHHAFCALLCVPWFYRLIYTVHEGELNNTSWRSRIIKAAIHISKIPIFVSHKEYLKSSKKNKQFLPCGVDFEVFKPITNKEKSKTELNLPTDKAIIFFPADPNRPEKNAAVLKMVESIALKKNKPWVFIYGGTIPKNEIANWMATADIVISIGKYESDGMVIKEAIACNTPILSTDVGNSRFYIDDNCGMIVHADSNQIYQSIEKIMQNPKRFSFGREKLIHLNQDMQNATLQLNNIYNQATSQK
ncbi:glycosyltransferase [Pseudomonas sp. BF-R-05]|uniref:glycosyltransferase n=1 Tax=Pseudomonas sp. BF-R-05 TaxID=2832364 RepID=UPI001CC0F6F2|nr:glycosyltransferase [Pseudomonas sp. BF-R-05]